MLVQKCVGDGPAGKGSQVCVAVSHICLPCLPSGRRVGPACILCPLMIGLMHNNGSVDVFLYG